MQHQPPQPQPNLTELARLTVHEIFDPNPFVCRSSTAAVMRCVADILGETDPPIESVDRLVVLLDRLDATLLGAVAAVDRSARYAAATQEDVRAVSGSLRACATDIFLSVLRTYPTELQIMQQHMQHMQQQHTQQQPQQAELSAADLRVVNDIHNCSSAVQCLELVAKAVKM
jgi:hypothetical protein